MRFTTWKLKKCYWYSFNSTFFVKAPTFKECSRPIVKKPVIKVEIRSSYIISEFFVNLSSPQCSSSSSPWGTQDGRKEVGIAVVLQISRFPWDHLSNVIPLLPFCTECWSKKIILISGCQVFLLEQQTCYEFLINGHNYKLCQRASYFP